MAPTGPDRPLFPGTVVYTDLVTFQRNNGTHDDSLRLSGSVLLILAIRHKHHSFPLHGLYFINL